jgi:hypothetical protein
VSRKLDVRWPEDLLTKAEGIALGVGVRTSAVLKLAAELGLQAAASELRRRSATRPSKMPSAGADGSPAVTAGTAAPRPAVPASARVRLDVVVARLLEGGHEGGPAPVSLARARRKIATEGIMVPGPGLGSRLLEKDPATLVDPREVSLP